MTNSHFQSFTLVTPATFEKTALDLFKFQYEHNIVYASYVNALGIDVNEIRSINKIPFIPIRFFKEYEIKSTVFELQSIFESSSTTGQIPSRHYVNDLLIYEQSFLTTFSLYFGSPKDYVIIGLLPSYLERSTSSLVYMVHTLIQQSGQSDSGFYLYDYDKLFNVLKALEKRGQKVLLFGVTFALLDFAEQYSLPLQYTTIIETGGMKGRRQELVREEVHALLKKSFGHMPIFSEYGMTELLSQAYSTGNGIFTTPPWMKVLLRDLYDPLSVCQSATTGAINIIDLANVYSCAFIATDDLGKLNHDGSFEVLGRIDHSEIRGCSLLAV